MTSGQYSRGSEDLLFAYSFGPLLALNFILLAIFVPILIVYAQTSAFIAALFFLILDALLLGSSLRAYLHRVHRARFFTNDFEVSGRRLNKKVSYEEITRVDRIQVAPILVNPVQIGIHVGDEEPIVIPANLRSKKLKVDLYSWLSKKAESRTGLLGMA